MTTTRPPHSKPYLQLIGEETIEILKAGKYKIDHKTFPLYSESRKYNSTVYQEGWDDYDYPRSIISITTDTTLAAMHKLYRLMNDNANPEEHIPQPVCLNFASGNNPGGGFLFGAVAQEESLCRASSLYPQLIDKGSESFYTENDAANPLFTDAIIYSPDVEFFRDDDGKLLSKPSYGAVITAAAPKFKNITNQCDVEDIGFIFVDRIKKVLKVAKYKGHNVIVLGAWGCGAYGNPPELVARAFHRVLFNEGWAMAFESIVFAIHDSTETKEVYNTFTQMLK